MGRNSRAFPLAPERGRRDVSSGKDRGSCRIFHFVAGQSAGSGRCGALCRKAPRARSGHDRRSACVAAQAEIGGWQRMRRLGVAGVPELRPPQKRIRPSGSRTLRSGASRDISAGSAAPAFRIAARHPAAVEMRRKALEIQACVNALRGIAEAVCRDSGLARHAWRRATRQANRCRPSRAGGGWRWTGGSDAAEKGGRTGGCAPGLRNRAGKVSERRDWQGADMAGRSVLRISDLGSHAVWVRAALAVCLCAGFLYAKGVPPRARLSAGWWLSAPIFRNTHNPDRRAPCRSVDGPPQE